MRIVITEEGSPHFSGNRNCLFSHWLNEVKRRRLCSLCSSGFLAKSGNCNASGSSGCNIRFFRAEVINVISRMYGFSFGTRVILIRKVSLKKKWSSFVGGLLSFVTCLIAVTLLNSVVAWLARWSSSIAPVEFVKSQNYMLRIPKSHKSCLAVFCHLDSKFKCGMDTNFNSCFVQTSWMMNRTPLFFLDMLGLASLQFSTVEYPCMEWYLVVVVLLPLLLCAFHNFPRVSVICRQICATFTLSLS